MRTTADEHHPAQRDGGRRKVKVRAGEYASESEVIRDGLRALMARDRVIEAWLLNGGSRGAGERRSRRALSADQVREQLEAPQNHAGNRE